MIKVFKATDRDFTSNGDAVIVPIKARVKNNVNGEFTLELTTESRFYDYLTQGNIIIAPTPQGEQAFRINNQVQRKGDRITVKARHVFYDSENLVIADSYAVDLTCEQALNHFNAATDSTSPFTMHSDITDLNTFRCVRKSLGEAIGTVIERWGGYLVRNNWDISVNKSIGRDLGVTIRYAKNLNELTASYDFSGVATKILPVGKDGILLPELYVYSTVQYSTPYTKAVTINQDINEDDYTTEEEYQAAVITDLRAQAQTLVNKTCYPVITYSLKGKPEKVQDIGDVIQVIDERIGVNITTQVIGYEWDIITESYANLTFGNFGNTLSGLMAKVNSNTKGIVQESVGEVKTEVKNSIDKIYDLLQGSYVVYRGYDILLLDTIPIGAATHVIKFSKDGILVSNNGVDGTFTKVYDITTQRLSVPSISLNGADLGTTLNKKLEAMDILAGSNISIRQDGNKVTISAAGSKGGNKVYAGIDVPSASIGAEDDLYLQLGVKTEDILAADRFEGLSSGSHVTSLSDFVRTARNKFSFVISGNPDSYGNGETGIFTLDGLVVGNTYHIEYDVQYNSGATFPYSGHDEGLRICDTYIAHPLNTSLNHVSGDFTYTANGTAKFCFWLIRDDTNFTCTITNLIITGNYYDGIDEIYGKISGKWEKYEGGETYTDFVGTDGTTDGASGLVPAPTTADVDKVLKSDGTWGTAGADVSITPSLQSGSKVAEYEINGVAGVLYSLTNTTGDYYNPIIYSTEEREVGVWTDGKPLYQKTIEYTPSGSLSSDVVIDTISNLERAMIVDAFAYKSADNRGVFLPNFDGNARNFLISWNSNGQLILAVRSDIWDSSWAFYVTVRYTKTTDVAGSGSYNTLGVPTVHYSTDEQVIGTWIDGKPLYRKIYTGLNVMPAYNYWTDMVATPTNMDIYIGSDIMICENANGNIDLNHTGLEIAFSKSDGMIRASYNQNANLRPINILSIQYTKTTD
jgi:phage minor structural protein